MGTMLKRRMRYKWLRLNIFSPLFSLFGQSDDDTKGMLKSKKFAAMKSAAIMGVGLFLFFERHL